MYIVHIVEIVARFSTHSGNKETYGTVNFEPFTIVNPVFCFARKYASFWLCFTFDAVKRLGMLEKKNIKKKLDTHTQYVSVS